MVLSSLAVARPLYAQGDAEEEYRSLVEDAVSEFSAGEYDEALTLFRQAYDIRPTARVLRGIGKAYFELSRYTECIEALTESLASDVDPLPQRLQADVEQLIARAERYVGTLRIEVRPYEAEPRIIIEGRRIESPRRPIPLNIGTHEVSIDADGYESERRVVEVVGRQQASLVVSLVPVVAEAAAPAPVPAPPPVASGTVVAPTPRTRNRTLLVSGATVSSIGVAGLVGSLVYFFDRDSALGDCEDAAEQGVACGNVDSIASQRDGALVGIAIGSGLAVTGAVLLAIYAAGTPEKSSMASLPLVSCGPWEKGASCRATVRF